MNKRLFVTAIIFVWLSLPAMAQRVELCDWQEMRLSFEGPKLQIGSTILFGSHFSTVGFEGSVSCNRVGQPDLPVLSRLVEVPLCEGFEVEIAEVEFDTIAGPKSWVAPCQPSRSKSDRTEPQLAMDRESYATDAFTEGPLAEVLPVGVARNVNLAQVLFSPVRYNPVRNQLIVVRHAEVTIRYRQPDRQATLKMKQLHSAHQAPMHYLIVSHPMFRGQLDDFVAWKRRKGFLVTEAYTDQPEVGTTPESIATYIKSFYDNPSPTLPAPAYLLLVGDIEQLPAFTGRYDYGGLSTEVTHPTDLYYATWTPGDLIPDCHYGRFSAQNISQLTPQVEKTLMYEQYTFADPSFLSRGILIAGVDGGNADDYGYRLGDPAMDYAAREYVNAGQGYNSVFYYKNDTTFAPAGVSVSGSSQAQGASLALRSLFNQGTAWVNYTAHGGGDCWANPLFSTTHVAQMTNSQKFGFMIGNCCVSGSFQDDECLGEALLRKGNYCGAVDYIGASNNTLWYEDFYWSVGLRNLGSLSGTMNTPYDAQNLGMYDRLFHTHNEAAAEQYTTAGAMLMAGNLAVQNSTSSGKNYYWEIYHNFGDPSLMPWIGEARPMDVLASSVVPINSPSLSLTAVPHAYCALTDGQGLLVGAAFADASGNAAIPLADVPSPGLYELAVSAQGYLTYFQDINIITASGPYVVAEGFGGTLNAGQPVQFGATLKNVGNAPTGSLQAQLLVDSSVLSLATSQRTLSPLAAGDSLVLGDLFLGSVASAVEDQALTEVTLRLTWNNRQSSERTYRLPVNAPRICVTHSAVAGPVEPGNSVTLTFTDQNQGHWEARDLACSLTSTSPYITVESGTSALGTLQPGDSALAQFTLTLAPSTPAGYYPLHHIVENANLRIDHTFNLAVGSTKEGFETGDFSALDWLQGSNPWVVTDSGAYAGRFCARSGAIGDNQTSELSIRWNAAVSDSISFHYNVSCENNYDKFRFCLDGQEMLVATGEENTWQRASYPVGAGAHLFVFSYTKDYSESRGQDCAWIDNLTLPLANPGDTADGAFAPPYFCGFESEAECSVWSMIDNDGDGYTWQASSGMRTHGGSRSMVSASYLNEVGVLTPDNWLLSPRFTIPEGGARLSWYAAPQDTHWAAEHYRVLLAPEGGSGVEDFSSVLFESTLTHMDGEWQHPEVEIEGPAQVRVAFVHCDCSDLFWLCLDDVRLDTIAPPEPPIGLPLSPVPYSLKVYPNPTTGPVTILTDSREPLRLYDRLGRLEQEGTIDLTPLPAGIYMLRQGERVVKVVRQ